MPRDALDAIQLIREHKLRQFGRGQTIRRRPLIWQRTVEGAYPARFSKGALDIIEYASDVDRDVCRVVSVRGNMALVRCRER